MAGTFSHACVGALDVCFVSDISLLLPSFSLISSTPIVSRSSMFAMVRVSYLSMIGMLIDFFELRCQGS